MRKKTHHKSWVAFFMLIILSLACSSQVTVFETPVPPNVETLVAGTLVVLTENAPKATNTFVSTVTSIPASATPESFGDVYVYTIVENVNLRVQPGTLFRVSRVMPNGTRLLLLGQSLGGEWLYVKNDEEVYGWVNVNVVVLDYDGPPPPEVEPTDVLLVTGKVLTEMGTPVSGIGFDVVQGARQVHALTDATGQFYVFLPRNMSGVWSVGYSSISCTSNTMDVNCNCKNNYCGSSYPESTFVELPQREPLTFVWK